MLLLQEKPTDPCSEFLTSRDANNLRQSDENMMSRVPTLESTNGFQSLRTFDTSNLSCGHLLFHFVVVNSICKDFLLLTKTQYFLDHINNQLYGSHTHTGKLLVYQIIQLTSRAISAQGVSRESLIIVTIVLRRLNI